VSNSCPVYGLVSERDSSVLKIILKVRHSAGLSLAMRFIEHLTQSSWLSDALSELETTSYEKITIISNPPPPRTRAPRAPNKPILRIHAAGPFGSCEVSSGYLSPQRDTTCCVLDGLSERPRSPRDFRMRRARNLQVSISHRLNTI